MQGNLFNDWSGVKGTRYCRWRRATGALSADEYALQDKEKQDRQAGARRQRYQPGHKDIAHHPQVDGGDTAGKTDAEDSAHQRVGGGNGQAGGRGADHGRGGAQFGGKTPARGQRRDFATDGGHHSETVGSQAEHNTHAAEQ